MATYQGPTMVEDRLWTMQLKGTEICNDLKGRGIKFPCKQTFFWPENLCSNSSCHNCTSVQCERCNFAPSFCDMEKQRTCFQINKKSQGPKFNRKKRRSINCVGKLQHYCHGRENCGREKCVALIVFFLSDPCVGASIRYL